MRAMNIHHPVAGVPRGDTLAERLRRARTHAGLTLGRAATAAKLSERRMKALEAGAGAAPDVATMQRLATAYAVPVMWLAAGRMAGAKFVPTWYRPGGVS